MFRTGKRRAFIHNLRLAVMLSFVAGIVNISGVLSINILTTNVTGHFAFFSEFFVKGNYQIAVHYISYIIAFLFGAICCGLIVEVAQKGSSSAPHKIPILLEIITLISVVTMFKTVSAEWTARILLFSMGLQNALVTKISKATVRTTHLTGLFTDLGIEISQLFFHRNEAADMRKLKKSIYLRLAIILFFFLGGVSGGFMFHEYQIKTLFLAIITLLIALAYENVRIVMHYYRRKFRKKVPQSA
ncbi:YoaK family protein [Chryseolinea sp. T2]|uniref:YoaK family protein n=1 Tax=Chryseolinea sp. T2 TaxID=3129255 RepID=UPI003078000B